MQASLLVNIINQHSYELKGVQSRVRLHLPGCNLYKTLQKDSGKAASFIIRVTKLFQKIIGLKINHLNSEQENCKRICIHKAHIRVVQ